MTQNPLGHKRPTAKQRVLARLQEAHGAWISGIALAEVGGYRFGGRILELRQDGHVIERRPDPRSAVHQYRLVEQTEQLELGVAS